MNKLGVSYNLFTGIELLEHSIKCIRKEVDYICVVYSLTSHRLEETKNSFIDELIEIKQKGLINEIIEYVPKKKQTRKRKRNTAKEFRITKM